MKNLSTFINNKISFEEQASVKGGIRFVTADKGLAKAKKEALKAQGNPFVYEKEICPVAGVRLYCIEW